MSLPSLERLETEVVACRRCPRLVEWREEVARTKRASYSDQTYWGRPVPGFGDPDAWLLIVGLAPGAHGANRTGRMFTGDRSGDWLYGSLHAAGLASQPSSEARDDGLTMNGVWITAVVRCAPPGNRPSTAERDACLPWLEAEIPLLTSVRVIVTLGGFAWTNTLRLLASLGGVVERPRPKFGHGAETVVDATSSDVISGSELRLLASYHPSQQNTFTGRLTREMLGETWDRARELGLG
ncbi:MAG: uracil-DNA glycosylase [marine benthic group bacterium]|nr:uracil-DNA glycosylase [Gemmatimonadota bacterium]MCL7974413.1 uracil-DNA glycosylase [Gemmatimonadota bacterium]MCL7985025.1 uracil-DNA glycosylase [Gemmatimonadota bacterium]